MRGSLSNYLREADEIIEKRASQGKPQTSAPSEDEVIKLASLLTQSEVAQQPQAETSSIQTLTEKVAHAIALVDTLMNLEQIQKLAEFEKKAKAAGHSDEQIEEFIKQASAGEKFKSVLKSLRAPTAAAAAGTAAGAALAHGKGKDSGYRQALQDVNEAFRQHSENA